MPKNSLISVEKIKKDLFEKVLEMKPAEVAEVARLLQLFVTDDIEFSVQLYNATKKQKAAVQLGMDALGCETEYEFLCFTITVDSVKSFMLQVFERNT